MAGGDSARWAKALKLQGRAEREGEMQLVRTYWPEGAFSFELEMDGDPFWVVAIRFPNKTKGRLTQEAAKEIAAACSRGLSPEEVVEAFGPFPIPPGWEVCLSSRGLRYCRPLSKRAVKQLTTAIRKWWEKGLNRCRNLGSVEGWLKDKLTIVSF